MVRFVWSCCQTGMLRGREFLGFLVSCSFWLPVFFFFLVVGFLVSKMFGFWNSKITGLLVPKSLGFLVSEFQIFEVSKFQCLKDSMVPYYQKIISCFLEDLDLIFEIFKNV